MSIAGDAAKHWRMSSIRAGAIDALLAVSRTDRDDARLTAAVAALCLRRESVRPMPRQRWQWRPVLALNLTRFGA